MIFVSNLGRKSFRLYLETKIIPSLNKKLKIIKFVKFKKKKRDRLLDRFDGIEWVGRVPGVLGRFCWEKN